MSINLFDVWCSKQEFLPRCWRKFSSWNALIDSLRGNLSDTETRKLLFFGGVTYAGALVLLAYLQPSHQRELLHNLAAQNNKLFPEEQKKTEKTDLLDSFFLSSRVDEALLLDAPETEEEETQKNKDAVSVGDPVMETKPAHTEEEHIRNFVEDVMRRAAADRLDENPANVVKAPTETVESTVLSPEQGDPSWTPLQQRLHKGVLEKYKNWRDGREYSERMSDAWGVVTFLLEKRKGIDLSKKKSTHNSRVKSGKLQPGEDTKRWSSLTDVIYGLALDADAYTIVAEMFPLPSHEEPHPELLRGMTTYPVVRVSRMGWGASNLS